MYSVKSVIRYYHIRYYNIAIARHMKISNMTLPMRTSKSCWYRFKETTLLFTNYLYSKHTCYQVSPKVFMCKNKIHHKVQQGTKQPHITIKLCLLTISSNILMNLIANILGCKVHNATVYESSSVVAVIPPQFKMSIDKIC